MDLGAYLYPWDLVGDPAAADRVAALGLDHVSVAAAYHGTRALTPRHPAHRVVVAEHTAAYYPTSDARWAGRPLRPPPPTWVAGPDPFGAAVADLARAGIPAHAWVVLCHRDGPGALECVENAYGDRYPWALCPARPAVLAYAVALAGEVAARPGIAGVELEACGWYGFDHLSAHDKVAGVPVDPYLFSLCFCPACRIWYHSRGLDPDDLARRVRTHLDQVFAGADPPPPDLAGIDAVRAEIADGFRAEVVAAVRAVRADLSVALHADPDPRRSLAFAGVDAAVAGRLVDRLVVRPDAVARTVAATGASVVANLSAVAGMGGRRGGLAEAVAGARAAGADGVRLYHAGLASAADLAEIGACAGDRGRWGVSRG